MENDEQSIRELIAAWHAASAEGEIDKILPLMAEDVVFLVTGHEPMRGRDAFAAAFKAGMQHFRIMSNWDVQEIKVAGSLAYCWSQLSVTMIPLRGGSPTRRSGYALTILRKEPDNRWVVIRDANMLTAEPVPSS